MDEAARRALLDAGEAEAVTVNQRALIDKILARYSAEFTCWRELIQNADDAGATTCELRFESEAHVARRNAADSAQAGPSAEAGQPQAPAFGAVLKNWVFRNDGAPFSGDDWSRLRRIAEGNPDESKIGAFGVGFYSLFSVAEEPLVASGPELMGFFWRGDSLFTKRAKSPSVELAPSGVPYTTFYLPLREPAPFSDSPLDLCRFLATSLTFTTRVKSLSLFWDDQLLCRLDKRLGTAQTMTMPPHLNATSPQKLMKARALESQGIQIDVEVSRAILDLAKPTTSVADVKASLASAFNKTTGSSGLAGMLSLFGRNKAAKEKPQVPPQPSPEEVRAEAERKKALEADRSKPVRASVSISVATANIAVTVDKAFSREIERSTKKPPPRETKVQIVTQSKDEYDASFAGSRSASGKSTDSTGDASRAQMAAIFQGVSPSLEMQGHVFIGFKTSQSSSFAGHLAARFIPTVEREAVDFVDRYCAIWNNELLAMAGYLMRAAYEAELAAIGKQWDEQIGKAVPKPGDETAQRLLDRALHTMRYLTCHTSTPSPRIGTALETAFFNASRQNTLTLASTRGVRHSSAIRFPNASLADFVCDLAVLPPQHVELASHFIAIVRSRGLVKDITLDDVFDELAGRALSVAEMIAALKWWVSVAAHPSFEPSLQPRFLGTAVVNLPATDDAEERNQALSTVSSLLNPQRVPPELPLPPSTLFYEVSKALSASDLSRTFGWAELSIAAWVSELARSSVQGADATVNIQLSPAFSEKVLGVVARGWGSMPAQGHAQVAQALKDVACIPTARGMSKPGESYMPQVALFPDLATVAMPTLPVKGNLEKVLLALGVRRHVELQLVFDRLVAPAGGWDVTQLLSYLATNKDSLSKLEIDRLAKTPIFRPRTKEGAPLPPRKPASQLYEPRDDVIALGLPVLDWAGKPWRATSDEARFAFDVLGLRRHPPLRELLSLASTDNPDADVRQKALKYFFEKHALFYRAEYTLQVGAMFAFVPCQIGETKTPALLKPDEVYTNPAASVMRFAIVDQNIVSAVDVHKLELRENPTGPRLVSALVSSGMTAEIDRARRIFEYLASTRELTAAHFASLKSTPFIPVLSAGSKQEGKASAPSITLHAPRDCYFKGGADSEPALREIFNFIDFGPEAAAFLRSAGVAKEPTTQELTGQLVRSPSRFLELLGDEGYSKVLRRIAAANWQSSFPSALRREMQRAPFLLGSKRVASSSTKAPPEKGAAEDQEDLDDGATVTSLKAAPDLVLVDDPTAYLLFSSHIYCAPMDDGLSQFCAQLGSPRLSTLVTEQSRTDGQVRSGTSVCVETRRLIVERTPLFFFEQQLPRSDIRRDAEWLKKEANFVVLEVDGRGLSITRTLRFGATVASNVQRCSAIAHSDRKLTLYVTADPDLYEVSDAITRAILSTRRAHLVPLYHILLSTSLRTLKKRGFHVDKIIAQRKAAETEAAEQLAREARRRAELEALQPRVTESEFKEMERQLGAVFPDADPAYISQQLRSQKSNHIEHATTAMVQQPYPKRPSGPKPTAASSEKSLVPTDHRNPNPAAGSGMFSNWRDRLLQGRRNEGPSSLAAGLSSIDRGPKIPGGFESPAPVAASARAGPQQSSGAQPGAGALQSTRRKAQAGSEVTPLSSIRNNVLQAIHASRADNSQRIVSPEQLTDVTEASSTYCDTSGVATDLRLAGKVAGMQVYLSPSLSPDETLERNGAALLRFIQLVLRPVAVDVFGVDPSALSVFCDVEGPSVAFNRGGSLFFNLRYYLGWHDADVEQGNRVGALISMASSVAHEVAHNLVSQHDSQHEFYMQSIAEEFFLPLAALVAQAQREWAAVGAGAARASEQTDRATLVDLS